MYYPFKWFIQDVNDSMRSKKTKEKLDNGECVSLAKYFPLFTSVVLGILIFCAIDLAPKIIPVIIDFFK